MPVVEMTQSFHPTLSGWRSDGPLEAFRLRASMLHEVAWGTDLSAIRCVRRRAWIDLRSANVIGPAFAASHVFARSVTVSLIRVASPVGHRRLLAWSQLSCVEIGCDGVGTAV